MSDEGIDIEIGDGRGCFWFLLGVSALIIAIGFVGWLGKQ